MAEPEAEKNPRENLSENGDLDFDGDYRSETDRDEFYELGGDATVKGRPRVQINQERLEHLRSLKFTWEEIGSLLGVSSKTVQRRAKEWGLKLFTLIADVDLDAMISDVLNQFPRYGEVMIRAHLQSQKVSYYCMPV